MNDAPEAMIDRIISVTPEGVRLAVKAHPGDNRHRPPRIVAVDHDRYALEIGVSAIAEGGKANKAIIATLSAALRLPKARLEIVSGMSSRCKSVFIQSDQDYLKSRILLWIAQG